jgi:predicted short-subunit dehydrogenase-like oxidoreductase (DUF2520 family)
MPYRIGILGSGNVATQLIEAFSNTIHKPEYIVGRNKQKIASLSQRFGCRTSNLDKIPADVDIWILAIKDDSINEVAKKFLGTKSLVVHTSGATSIEVLSSGIHRSGVFYPLQSITSVRKVDWNLVPILIESSRLEDLKLLKELGESISNAVIQMNSQKREKVHLAAVILNNFTNMLVSDAYDWLGRENIPFSIFLPLLKETVDRLETSDPANLQTGPARRKDQGVIDKHLELLANNEDLKGLYTYFSRRIISKFYGDQL